MINLLDNGTNVDTKYILSPNSSYKFVVTSTGYSVSVNGETPVKHDFSFENVRISFYLYSIGDIVTYNNFVIYDL